eukprot:TRINITY_DN11248_c1_g1_i1.p2 TRINITY_DN11248_c1_g1~~TRINITY_DN11248_c1_g1_i1.p2  ORF type:complete len:284 (+),score=24.86 TRINITY_DN11248_c1_g1_i1:326-1177(+)
MMSYPSDNTSDLLDELELLRSMLTTKELTIDSDILDRIEANPKLVSGIICTIHLHVTGEETSKGICDIIADISRDYPERLPAIRVRSSMLRNEAAARLCNDLQTHLNAEFTGEQCLFEIFSWTQQHLADYTQATGPDPPLPYTQSHDRPLTIMREYVYFHHIYNMTKRKNIVSWARQAGLHGFSVCGKPGLLCAEGPEESVKEYILRLRKLSWQKMQSKAVFFATCEGPDWTCSARYPPFEELVLDAHGTRGNHANMGQVRAFLEEHDDGEVFKAIFSIGDDG